jgi:hypothetical protein
MNSALNEIVTVAEGGKILDLHDRSILRGKIALLEKEVKKEPQVDIEPVHNFSKDVYAREISIPKGSLIIGKIHKFQNLNIISKGDLSFFSIDGAFRVQAPHTFVASPGVKRVIYAHEDSVWTTIHGTSETDLEKIEEIFIAKDYREIEGITEEELKLIAEVQDVLDNGGDGGSGCLNIHATSEIETKG